MTKTFARLHLAHNRIMSVLIIEEMPEYYDVQVVKDSFWNTNDFIKVGKGSVKNITDRI